MKHDNLSPGLYIAATPIGNLDDVTVRVAKALAQCDVVACEDTRVTRKLMTHLGLTKPLWRHDDHSDDDARAHLIAAMRDKAVVLVSDAGTPLISDPGYRLVREARAAGIAITSLPGPSAPIVALTLSGLPCDRFLFAGFLPAKDKARAETLTELASVPATLVFLETAPRLIRSLNAMGEVMGGREVAVARELTKKFEECRHGTAAELAAHYSAHPPRGEIVLMVGPPGKKTVEQVDIDDLLRDALASCKPSQAAARVAKLSGADRKTLYARALELNKK